VSATATGSSALIGKLKVSLHQSGANDGSTCSGAIIGTQQAFSGNPTLVSGRTLAAGVSEQVCIKVTVDST
ncbi:hypothetical protein QM646_52060, partial [Rhodococcus erythropolis]|nr:hypothetical protein [Rhodococcus erythropolis]